ncbi:MAG TPA: hypothetical protein VLB87_08180 [Pyrinomonadaceae bacterium]|nr:hypothetical protein [Pyrinomonadaceae bacterium]
MKARLVIVCLLLAVLGLSLSIPAPAQEQKRKSEKFGALAYMPHGAGPAMVGTGARMNVDLYVDNYTSDEDAKQWAMLLRESGPNALLKALEKAKTIGKIRLTGRVGFYDFKLIRSHQTENGRRIYAVGDRPVGFLEVYAGNRSLDYPFGILQLDLKKNSKGREEGTGALIYSAKIKVLDGNSIDVETYGIGPIQLMGVRKL